MGKKKFFSQTELTIGLNGDEDTVAGMVLAGIGHVDGQDKNNSSWWTHLTDIDAKFQELRGCADGHHNDPLHRGLRRADLPRSRRVQQERAGHVPATREIPCRDRPRAPRQDAALHRVALFRPAAVADMGTEARARCSPWLQAASLRLARFARALGSPTAAGARARPSKPQQPQRRVPLSGPRSSPAPCATAPSARPASRDGEIGPGAPRTGVPGDVPDIFQHGAARLRTARCRRT
ncbi:unnamed protein product [Prorocentrum cordatum]|uniref:Uncharacterized protein n=1 Tax=Prorocentrum cordatum TaxID=2364126 RepID=A0ABN9RAU4_9DINO|nr:unnamed protein product [Polarella glacialis]